MAFVLEGDLVRESPFGLTVLLDFFGSRAEKWDAVGVLLGLNLYTGH